MTNEITGQLIGGPDDGNMVTATVEDIAIVSTNVLWLDGKGDGKIATIVETRGNYVWQHSGGYFMWTLESSKVLGNQAQETEVV